MPVSECSWVRFPAAEKRAKTWRAELRRFPEMTPQLTQGSEFRGEAARDEVVERDRPESKVQQENTPAMLENFAATVESYFADGDGRETGGMEIQFNIVDHDTLVKAAENPAATRSYWSGSPATQLISRTSILVCKRRSSIAPNTFCPPARWFFSNLFRFPRGVNSMGCTMP